MARPFVDYSQDPAHSYPLVTLVSGGEENADPGAAIRAQRTG
jgi:hypothetical protein